jgi:hypothetical protein
MFTTGFNWLILETVRIYRADNWRSLKTDNFLTSYMSVLYGRPCTSQFIIGNQLKGKTHSEEYSEHNSTTQIYLRRYNIACHLRNRKACHNSECSVTRFSTFFTKCAFLVAQSHTSLLTVGHVTEWRARWSLVLHSTKRPGTWTGRWAGGGCRLFSSWHWSSLCIPPPPNPGHSSALTH